MVESLQEAFPGKVIPKGVALQPPFDRLPRYVADYLVAKFACDGDPEKVNRLAEFVRRHYPAAERGNWAKDQLLRSGRVVLIDELRVKPDLTSGRHLAEIPSLGDVTFAVSAELCARVPSLLYGLWGTLELRYDRRERAVALASFTPFQVVADLDSFLRGRSQYTEEQWIDVLLAAVGLNPAKLTARQKQLSVVRLAPLVEPRLQLMELGPRQTGKSFLLRNTSSDVFLVSSSSVSPATLFYHQVSRRPGLVLAYPVLVFDEIGHGRWLDRELIGTLNDFMESGRFSRGGRQFSAQTSLVFLGNTDSPAVPQSSMLPGALTAETGFLDRLNGVVNGHELPKITHDLLFRGPGLAVDYLAEVFRLLRPRMIDLRLGALLPSSFKERDVRSVKRLASAFLKLVYPAGDWPPGAEEPWVALALELRERVWQELSAANPLEFPPRKTIETAPVATETAGEECAGPVGATEQ